MLRLLDPYRWLLAGLAVLTFVAALAWYHHRTLERGREEVRQQVAAEAAEQIQRVIEQNNQIQKVKDEAIEQAAKRAQANAASAVRARTELDRLRKQVASAPSVSGDSCAAAIDRASTLGTLLGECAERYSAVAASADGHLNDALTLRQAWPAYDQFSRDLDSFNTLLKGQQ